MLNFSYNIRREWGWRLELFSRRGRGQGKVPRVVEGHYYSKAARGGLPPHLAFTPPPFLFFPGPPLPPIGSAHRPRRRPHLCLRGFLTQSRRRSPRGRTYASWYAPARTHFREDLRSKEKLSYLVTNSCQAIQHFK